MHNEITSRNAPKHRKGNSGKLGNINNSKWLRQKWIKKTVMILSNFYRCH